MSSRLSVYRPVVLIILFFFVHELALGDVARVQQTVDTEIEIIDGVELTAPSGENYAKVDAMLDYIAGLDSPEAFFRRLAQDSQGYLRSYFATLVEQNLVVRTWRHKVEGWLAGAKDVCQPVLRFGLEQLYKKEVSEDAAAIAASTAADLLSDQIFASPERRALRQATACFENTLVAKDQRQRLEFRDGLDLRREGRFLWVNDQRLFKLHQKIGSNTLVLEYKDTKRTIGLAGSFEAALLSLPAFIEQIKVDLEADASAGFFQKLLGIEKAYAMEVGTIIGAALVALIFLAVGSGLAIIFIHRNKVESFLDEHKAAISQLAVTINELAADEELLDARKVAAINQTFSEYIANLQDSIPWRTPIDTWKEVLQEIQQVWSKNHTRFKTATEVWITFLRGLRSDVPGLEAEVDKLIRAEIKIVHAFELWRTEQLANLSGLGAQQAATDLRKQLLAAIEAARDNVEEQVYGQAAADIARSYVRELVDVWKADPSLFAGAEGAVDEICDRYVGGSISIRRKRGCSRVALKSAT